MKRKSGYRYFVVLLSFLTVFTGFLGWGNWPAVLAEGTGSWDSPYSVAQAIQIQDNSVATVQGYIVGLPTAADKVITSNFTGDTAIAIADLPGETDTNKMLYVQVASSYRPDFGLKTNPQNMGVLVKVTGNLTPYFTPHPGLKNPTRMEKVVTEVKVTGVSLDKTSVELAVGETLTLVATVQPADATNKNVTWASDHPEVVSVDNGKVTAVAAGTATVTVTTVDGGYTASCTVVVKPVDETPVAVTGVSLDQDAITLEVGKSATLVATVEPPNAANKTVTWTSSDDTICTVDSSGKVTGVAEGTATITVTTVEGNYSASCQVTVVAAPEPTILSIAEARTKTLGEVVTVQGVVTFVDGKNYYIQDDTAAIDIYGSGWSARQGDMLLATGTLAEYKGLLEINPDSNAPQVTILSSDNPLPEPKIVTIPQINDDLESQLVKIENVTLGTINTSGNTPITDSSGNAINIYKIPALTGIAAGDKVHVVAVVSQYNSFQLRVRSANDVIKAVEEADTVPPVITHTPVAEGNTNSDLMIKATVTDDRSVAGVTLYYRTKGQTGYKELPMVLTNGEYAAAIPKAELTVAGLEYYIAATDGVNTATSPADINQPYQVTISDADIVPPKITGVSPEDGAAGVIPRPEISAAYSDPSGIDTASVKLYLDEVDVTADAAVTEAKVTYTPAADLAQGLHTVKVEVADASPAKNKAALTWTFTVGEEEYNFYFGQLHSHTNYSDGQGTPDDAYKWARDTAQADFFAITDHSNSFDNDLDWTKSVEWQNLHTIADQYNKDGEFVAIAGFEMTWSGSTGGWGHINTFNTEWFESRNNQSMDLPAYYNKISQYPDSISQLNHPGTTFGDFADFGYYSPAVDNVVHLIEVGNGEGPVRGSGYFPSYEYYTRALDKGWHLAPSNNQDNHKANWVTANTARTVILAPQLTRNDIYDAIRKMRVYATEDENLRIMYKVNGRVMGSFLDNPDELAISIEIADPDSTDQIGKVSIITSGGQVVAEKNFAANTAEWDLTLDAQHPYYYVRVDQADKDIAVTAPVWTGQGATPVGIAKVETPQPLAVTNTPVTVAATVFNNGAAPLSNVLVEFFVNTIDDTHKIGEAAIPSVASGGAEKAAIDWTPTAAGTYTLYAQTVLNVDGSDKVFTASTSLEVVNPEDAVKVVIDAGHYNQYVNGDYAGKISTLKAMLAEKKFLVVENPDALTPEDLAGAKLLILTDPQSKDVGGLSKSLWTEAEVQAIKDFTDQGGSLIITSRADYNDKGVTDPIYQSANQGNKVLQAIGSNLRFNDDEVIDNSSNGGQNYRLYFDDYTSSLYHLTDNIPAGQTYSFYSGCSLVLTEGGDSTAVDILVKGHDTTETLDSDGQNDNIPVPMGDVKALAAEILPSGAKVVVAGTTFFSDFETASGDNAYSNRQITENIIDWLTAPKPVELKTIAEVRADMDQNGVPDLLGQKFTVEGRVTAQSVAVGTNNAFFDVIYVQDETGGITVFGVSEKAIPLGVKVKVTGKVDQYDGDAELQIANENTDVQIIDPNPVLVEPKIMTTGESMREENEGWLVQIQGKVTRMTENALYLDDGTGEARVYVNGYIGDGTNNPDMLGKWDPTIKVGDTVRAIGLASEDPEGHRLRVRNTAEIVKVSLQSNDATLKDLQINGKTVEGFAPNIYEYYVQVPGTTAVVPEVKAIPTNDKATVKTTPATTVPGTTVIEVTAEDGTTLVYKVHFILAVEIEKISPESEFALGSDARVTIRATNKNTTCQAVTLIVAVYDDSNKLVNLVAVHQDLLSGQSAEITGLLRLPSTGRYTVKSFVWDTLQGMQPLSKVIEIPVK